MAVFNREFIKSNQNEVKSPGNTMSKNFKEHYSLDNIDNRCDCYWYISLGAFGGTLDRGGNYLRDGQEDFGGQTQSFPH